MYFKIFHTQYGCTMALTFFCLLSYSIKCKRQNFPVSFFFLFGNTALAPERDVQELSLMFPLSDLQSCGVFIYRSKYTIAQVSIYTWENKNFAKVNFSSHALLGFLYDLVLADFCLKSKVVFTWLAKALGFSLSLDGKFIYMRYFQTVKG